ncbi:uncharacterized protein LOC122660821 [Telopea speciosissima]|uniref:uncharacterized protein LOC122660821 n=1 Tax=Telopea speciosissima TaxID=54955 RepID=UPI001CC37EBB|nr:uncharacterized protein LOC122660821 [Telopea speciosissima]
MEATKFRLLSQTAVTLPSLKQRRTSNNTKCKRNGRFVPPLKVVGMAKESSGSGDSIIEKVAILGGLVSTPVIGWSLYTLKTTGCGLPPGPGGSIGALEGVSYLVVVGITAWSLYTKTKRGSGLPNGPYGLLGAVEGLSYLALLAIAVVFGLQFLEKGSLPGPVPVPGDQCFG